MKQHTIELPDRDAEFLEAYARRRGLSIGEVVQRLVDTLRDDEDGDIHPDVRAVTGLVPPDVNAEAEYRQHQLRKHGS